MLPRFPFTFRKDYGVANARNIVYTATQGDKPGTVNVTWTGNGEYHVTLNYKDSDVAEFIDNGTRIRSDMSRDFYGDLRPSWTLLEEAPLVEQPKPALSFDGKTFVPQRDGIRLTAQYLRVFRLMSDMNWRSLKDISSFTGDPEASVSARLRDLRKEKFGAHTVERRHVESGLYEYRLAA